MKKPFTEEQIIGFLREADAGMAVKELCRRHDFSKTSYYLWRNKFGGMSVSDAKRLRELETENGRGLECLTIVEDATHECVAIVPEWAISGQTLTRILDRLALSRGLPQVIRTDNGKEFCGRVMVTWAHGNPIHQQRAAP